MQRSSVVGDARFCRDELGPWAPVPICMIGSAELTDRMGALVVAVTPSDHESAHGAADMIGRVPSDGRFHGVPNGVMALAG